MALIFASLFFLSFSHSDIRAMILEKLENKILQTCEELYWNDPELRSPFDPKYNPVPNPTKTGAYEHPNARNIPRYDATHQAAFLQRSLDQAISMITRSGVGKTATNLLIQRLLEQTEKLTEDEIFKQQPEVRQKVTNIALDILKSKEFNTSELIESNMKAYKEGVDITQAEWEASLFFGFSFFVVDDLKTKNKKIPIFPSLGWILPHPGAHEETDRFDPEAARRASP